MKSNVFVIVGVDHFRAYSALTHHCDELVAGHSDVVIHTGDVKGTDDMVETWANSRKIPVKRFTADWRKYGRSAGHKRNNEMIEGAKAILVFWDGVQNGYVWAMIDMLDKKQIEYKIIET